MLVGDTDQKGLFQSFANSIYLLIMIVKKHLIFFILGILLITLSVYLFTKPAIWPGFDFSETGQIGDTIGGISAPFINIIGAVLVYLSFIEQFKANQIQRNALNNEIARNKEDKEFDLLFSLFRDIKTDLDNFHYYEVQTHANRLGGAIQVENLKVSGATAIEELILHVDKCNSRGKDFNLTAEKGGIMYIIGSLRDLRHKISVSNLSGDDKDLLLNKVVFFYNAKLGELVKRILVTDFKDAEFIKFIQIAHTDLIQQ